MAGSDGQVGGVQLDLIWDTACMTAADGAGDAAKCTANPASGKSVLTKIFSAAPLLRTMGNSSAANS